MPVVFKMATQQSGWYEDDSFLGYTTVQSLVITLIEVLRTSETSIYFNETTRRYIPESCHLHTRRRANLKSEEELECPADSEERSVTAMQRSFRTQFQMESLSRVKQ
jgi:hypothetical protein